MATSGPDLWKMDRLMLSLLSCTPIDTQYCGAPWHDAHVHTIFFCRLQGGAIGYAAAVASAYGVKACVVTAAGPDADLAVFSGHELHVVPTNSTLTFEHSYTWWGKYLPWALVP